MKEIMQIFLGQAGVQIGDRCWQLFSQEHDILSQQPQGNFQSLFNAKNPRTLFVDSEPDVICQARKNHQKNQLCDNNFVEGKESSGSNSSLAKFCQSSELREEIDEKLRKQIDECDQFQGFIFYFSLSGGSGSGLGQYIAQIVKRDYGEKLYSTGFLLSPSQHYSNCTVEYINTVLSIRDIQQSFNSIVLLENQALYDICQRQLKIDNPYYQHINDILAQVTSCYTSNLRFNGNFNESLNEIHNNLILYPSMNFLQCSISKLVPIQYENRKIYNEIDLTLKLFDNKNFLSGKNHSSYQYLSSNIFYRGNFQHSQAQMGINCAKYSVNFVDWNHTGFKYSICQKQAQVLKNSGLGNCQNLSIQQCNSTSVLVPLQRIAINYDKLFHKRAFVHWYIGVGFCEGEFSENRYYLENLIDDYTKIS